MYPVNNKHDVEVSQSQVILVQISFNRNCGCVPVLYNVWMLLTVRLSMY